MMWMKYLFQTHCQNNQLQQPTWTNQCVVWQSHIPLQIYWWWKWGISQLHSHTHKNTMCFGIVISPHNTIPNMICVKISWRKDLMRWMNLNWNPLSSPSYSECSFPCYLALLIKHHISISILKYLPPQPIILVLHVIVVFIKMLFKSNVEHHITTTWFVVILIFNPFQFRCLFLNENYKLSCWNGFIHPPHLLFYLKQHLSLNPHFSFIIFQTTNTLFSFFHLNTIEWQRDCF